MSESLRIVCNQKLLLNSDEWEMFDNICKSYDRPNFKGIDLFNGLFETNNEGIIVCLKPPSNKYISMEIFLFLSSIFQHQHMRIMYKEIQDLANQVKSKLSELSK